MLWSTKIHSIQSPVSCLQLTFQIQDSPAITQAIWGSFPFIFMNLEIYKIYTFEYLEIQNLYQNQIQIMLIYFQIHKSLEFQTNVEED